MPAYPLPAIDQNIASGWTEQQRDLYNYLPFFMVKQQIERRKQFTRWPKLCGKIPWQPNMGEVMKGVRQEPSPVIRQTAYPNELSAAPVKDIIDMREVVNTQTLKSHQFESPIFQFYPSFRDFYNDHVQVHGKDIQDKMNIFEDMFLRTYIWNYCPNVFLPGTDLAGGSMVASKSGVGNAAGTAGKDTGTLQYYFAHLGNQPGLMLTDINLATTMLANDLGVPPATGSNNDSDISKAGLQEKYVLLLSTEAYNQFFYDPWMLAHKNIQLDVILDSFRGNLFGQVTCQLERYPMRFLADGTMPAPEIRVGNNANAINPTGNGTANDNNPYNDGETIPNPAYVTAPYEVAFLVGAEGFDAITIGPPPKAFAGNGMPDGFGKMTWNGELFLTKNLLIQSADANGNTVYDLNNYGRFIRWQSWCTYGIMPRQRRNVLPIIFARKRGV